MDLLYVKCLAELIGTMILILLGNGVCANVALKKTGGNNSGLIVIASGWAFAVYVAASITSPISGAHLNPALTIGLAFAGNFEWSMVVPYIISQMIGAFLGAVLMYVHYKDHFDATPDGPTKRGVFCTAPSIRNYPRNVLSEIIGTFVLVFFLLYFTSGEGLGSVGTVPVAILIWAIGVSLGGTTGYAINPARDLGPRIAHALLPIKDKGDSDWGYSWVPVIGPVIGGIIAGGLYVILQPYFSVV
ncbi:MAG: aquaporin family protein [Flavobacteriaceae bacterium]|jgi:glycerol uptake facilitator protein|nr:aquaporin family protein [Flavobacteriaceae bacterium]